MSLSEDFLLSDDLHPIDIVETLADDTVRKRFADLGQEIPPRAEQTQQALAKFHKEEIDKWWPLIKAANIKVE